MIDRRIFFDHVRAEPFNGFLSGSQFTGLSNILDEAEHRRIIQYLDAANAYPVRLAR